MRVSAMFTQLGKDEWRVINLVLDKQGIGWTRGQINKVLDKWGEVLD